MFPPVFAPPLVSPHAPPSTSSLAQGAEAAGLVVWPEELKGNPNVPDLDEKTLQTIAQAGETIAADSLFDRVLDIARTRNRQAMRDFLRSSEFQDPVEPERTQYFDRLSFRLNNEIETFQESKEYEGDLHDNANRLDAWYERFRVVADYLARKFDNDQKAENDPTRVFLPSLDPPLDASSWQLLHEWEQHYLELVDFVNGVWHQLDDMDEPTVSPGQAQQIAMRSSQLIQQIEGRADLAVILDSATRLAIQTNLINRPKSPWTTPEARAAARQRLPKNVSELLQMVRGAGGAGPVETALIHVEDLTRLAPELRIGGPPVTPALPPGVPPAAAPPPPRAVRFTATPTRRRATPSLRSLLMMAHGALLDTWNRKQGNLTQQQMHQAISGEAYDFTLRLLEQSEQLECVVCGFLRYVRSEFLGLYRLPPRGVYLPKLFRCSDGTTLLPVLCGDQGDAQRIQEAATGFAKYAAVYEDERLARLADLAAVQREKRAKPYIEIGPRETTEGEEKNLRRKNRPSRAKPPPGDPPRKSPPRRRTSAKSKNG